MWRAMVAVCDGGVRCGVRWRAMVCDVACDGAQCGVRWCAMWRAMVVPSRNKVGKSVG